MEMASFSDQFTATETHGYLQAYGVEVRASSENRGWTSVYASLQHQAPFEGTFDAVDDHFIVLHLDQVVAVHRRVRGGEDSRVVAPGGLFIMPGGMDFGVRVAGSLDTLHLYLRRSVIEEVAAGILPGDPARIELLPRCGDHDRLIEELLLGIRDALYQNDPSDIPYTDHLARALAARLIRRHSSASAPAPRPVPKLSPGRLGRAVAFMEANLDQLVSLRMLGQVTELSPSHFARQFRAAVGKPPHQYLIELRVERACRLLRDRKESIAGIALACGFANQEHLTRLFKRHCGITPAEYRRMRQD
jgi:AraC family transcriptional regulator